MFIQVIKGHVSDAEEVRAALDRWAEQQAPRASGWLGTTAGVADDGTFIALVRFDSEEAARRNSERPEQHQWWTTTAKLFSGEITFHDCRKVVELGRGGSDEAGFVQVIQGRIRDVERMKTLSEEFEAAGQEFRPDVIGGIVALHGDGDGDYTNAIYFASEQEAREGERKEPPAEMKAQMEEQMALHEGQPTFIDLRRPWLHSAH